MSGSTFSTVFLDDGGVINDNRLRSRQWQRLVGEFFAPRLGGAIDAWAEANARAVPPLWPRFFGHQLAPGERHSERFDAYLRGWLEAMCEVMGVPAPGGPTCDDLAREAHEHIIGRVRAPFPGAAEAIRELRMAGFELHTASGGQEWELEAYLGGIGVRESFGTLFGADLIDTLKAGPEYYERVFAAAGVDPRDAVIVDDSPDCVAWARQVGARAILITPDAGPGSAPSLAAAVRLILRS